MTASQAAAASWLRESIPDLDAVPLPGGGATLTRWRYLTEIAAIDLALARLAEGHLDARAILAELDGGAPPSGKAWGVWAAEPGRVRAERANGGWHLRGEKRWCSGAPSLDRALVTATAPDGPRLFIVDPADLDPVVGSWPAIGMEATASLTMRFDLTVGPDAALSAPNGYVDRPGFWHGGAGVAACWFGGALGVAERLRTAAVHGEDRVLHATWGRVKARLEAAGALLQRSADEIDAEPGDVDGARRRAMRLRLVVEEAARFTVTETTIALGAGPLAHERDYAQRVGDLELYLRQLRPEGAAADFGAQYVKEPVAVVSVVEWLGDVPSFRPRVVIAAPRHPDDEVLGCAGIMSWLGWHGFDVAIVAVTDGDASHPRSHCITRDALVERRIVERETALCELGMGQAPIERLGFADAGVAEREAELADALADRLDRGTTLIAPWKHDGHPDHEAVARAGRVAAHRTGVGCLEVPIWARVRGRRCLPSFVLGLGHWQRQKRRAAETYRSQLIPLGPTADDGPVVHPGELDALTSATEWLVEVS